MAKAAQHRHDEFVGYRIYDAHRALSRNLEQTLTPFGVTPGEWNALNQLDRLGPLSQKQLADALQKEQATITRSVDRMVRKGLVERNPDPNDRRANIVSLTPDARDLLTRIEPAAVKAAQATVAGIEDSELEAFLATLARIRKNATAKMSED